MRTYAIVFSVALVLGFANAAQAELVVTELFNVDPGWEAGGYWELTVTNSTLGDVYMIAVGNTGADLIVVRYPDLVGVWNPERVSIDEWDTNEWPRRPTDWPTPDTSLYPSAVEFPGHTQVLVYYVLGSFPPLGVGATMSGLYFNYPIESAASARTAPASGGSPFLAFNGAGEVVARGVTVGDVLPVQDTTWGAIKALYR
jgi:hypothetical protein